MFPTICHPKMMSSTENEVTDKENKDGWLSILISGEKLIHSRNIHHRDIHSVRHIQDHVHRIHRTGMHQHQPWAQLHAFHSICIQDQDHDHSIRCIQDHVHSIHHTGKHQHQPWVQPHAFHSSCIQDRVHSIHYSQDHVHNIHHKGMAQLPPHAFHNKNILVHGTQNIQGVQVHTRDILRTEGRGQHQPWAWPRAQQ